MALIEEFKAILIEANKFKRHTDTACRMLTALGDTISGINMCYETFTDYEQACRKKLAELQNRPMEVESGDDQEEE
jgi:hypothetical protein